MLSLLARLRPQVPHRDRASIAMARAVYAETAAILRAREHLR